MSTSKMWDLAMEAGRSPEVTIEEVSGAQSFCEWDLDLGLGIYPGKWRGYRFPDGRVVRVRVLEEA